MWNYDELAEAMGELEDDRVRSILEDIMAGENPDGSKAMEACQKGMEIVGSRFEDGEYFVGDLIFAGELMTEAVSILKSALGNNGNAEAQTKMLICTVKDDLHDIGKNIVKALLETSGFDVLDLGIDVEPQKIVETVKEENIKIVALSGVLTLAIDSMKDTVDAIRAAGLDDVKVIIGGAPVNAAACETAGADAWAHNPQKTIEICQAWAAEN